MANISIRRGGGIVPPRRYRLTSAILVIIATVVTLYVISIRSILLDPSSRQLIPEQTKAAPILVGPDHNQDSIISNIVTQEIQHNKNISTGSTTTPSCHPHTTQDECTGSCQTIGEYIKQRRNDRGMWHWYYPHILEYYKCINATIVVEVGAAFGGQTQYMLKYGADQIREYHVVDPFMAGYDKRDAMSRWMQKAAPDASPADISIAWYKSISLALGTVGEYPDEGMDPAGCRLRMHQLKSVDGAKLFPDHSIDAVFIDGLHTYDGVVDDINAWRDKVKLDGGALIFNDYNMQKQFGGISKAVKEEAGRRGLTPVMIDRTNAVLGGKAGCATKQVPF